MQPAFIILGWSEKSPGEHLTWHDAGLVVSLDIWLEETQFVSGKNSPFSQTWNNFPIERKSKFFLSMFNTIQEKCQK